MGLRSITDWKLLVAVFSTIFIAEIGDKTRLATILYASGAEYGKLTVFLGSSLALVLTSALGVLVGASLAQSQVPVMGGRRRFHRHRPLDDHQGLGGHQHPRVLQCSPAGGL